MLLGLLISPPFARLLPFGLDGRVAPFILHADRWNAGRRVNAGTPSGGLAPPGVGREAADTQQRGVSGLLGRGGEDEERAALQSRWAGAVISLLR